MKRFLIALCAFLVIGCSNQSAAPASSAESKRVPKQSSVAPSSKSSEKEPPIDLNDIVLERWLLEPDSIGDIYISANYTNNTDIPIVGVSYKVHLKDSNEIIYLDNYDTVLPGETSPDFKCFGPSTGKMEDAQIVSCEYILQDFDGTKTYIDYDNKLDYLEWFVVEK